MITENPMQYQLLPHLSEQEYEDLKADIAARGVMVPVEKDEYGNLLDGFHRSQICAQLGLTDYPVTIRAGMTHEEKVDHALTLNLSRRHLNTEQRRELVLKLHTEEQWSNRQIADRLSVDETTIRRDLAGAAFAAPEMPTHTIGKDGKSYPAKRAPKTIVAQSEQQAEAAVKLLGISSLMDGGDTTFNAKEIIDDGNKTLYANNPNRLAPMMSSDSFEWYTPVHVMDKARSVLGRIDLDPCTSELANQTVQAAEIFTEATDGLSKEWRGTVFMNPPYGDTISQWVEKLCVEFAAGRVTQAIALLPARTDTAWFRLLRDFPRCFLYGRLKFGESTNSAPFPSVVVALGCDEALLADVFNGTGDVYSLVRGGAK